MLPVPAFGYAPETGFYFGAVALATLRYWTDSTTRTSAAKLETNYTENHQFIIEMGANIFTKAEKYNIDGNLGWKHFPEYWWGMGNNTRDSAKTLYDAFRLEADLRVAKQVHTHLFLGLRYKLLNMYGVNNARAPGSEISTTGVNGGFYQGLGPTVNFDNRTNILNPSKGYFVQISALVFSKAAGCTSDFFRFESDLRKYWSLRKGKDVLAIQAYSLLSPGEPPFRLTGLLGSDREMRGYYQGRYRDQYYFAAQAEYRLHLFWRIGVVAFAGAGDVRGRYSTDEMQLIKYTVGSGVRILMNKKDNINLRFDVAFGSKNNQGFYVAFGEAF